ncbi:MAG TPA: hypothetical protein VLN26_12005, partial [Gaiellaceae bacterium]|nr:hypothetical protein [Gaiellaceae bacterium]
MKLPRPRLRPQARRGAAPSPLAQAAGLRCGRRHALAWPETAPQGRHFHIKPLADELDPLVGEVLDAAVGDVDDAVDALT